MKYLIPEKFSSSVRNVIWKIIIFFHCLCCTDCCVRTNQLIKFIMTCIWIRLLSDNQCVNGQGSNGSVGCVRSAGSLNCRGCTDSAGYSGCFNCTNSPASSNCYNCINCPGSANCRNQDCRYKSDRVIKFKLTVFPMLQSSQEFIEMNKWVFSDQTSWRLNQSNILQGR